MSRLLRSLALLDLAAVLALSVQCAPTVSPRTLAAIAYVESRFDPLAIGVNRGRAAPRPRTVADAISSARRLIAAGANIDLGLAQINSGNLDWLSLSVEDAFDPCRNLAAASVVLRTGFQPLADTAEARRQALRTALSRYNTGHPESGFRNGYVARVEAAAVRLNLVNAQLPASPASAVAVIGEAPVEGTPPPAWDIFARAQWSAALSSPQSQPWSVFP